MEEFVAAVTNEIINPILGIIFAAALFMFVLGASKLALYAGDDTKRSEGKQHLLWGIIGMVVMVSVYAILQVGLATFDVDVPDYLPR